MFMPRLNRYISVILFLTAFASMSIYGCSGGKKKNAVSSSEGFLQFVIDSTAGYDNIEATITSGDTIVWDSAFTIDAVPWTYTVVLPAGHEYETWVEFFLGTEYLETSSQTGVIIASGDTTVVTIGSPDLTAQVKIYNTVTTIDLIHGDAYSVTAKYNLAYIAAGWGGMVICDVSDIENPVQLSVFDEAGAVREIEISGDYAYLAYEGAGLKIVDISNPEVPVKIGELHLPGNAMGLEVRDDIVYAADYDKGLRVIDVSNPAEPAEIGYWDTPGRAWKLDLEGNTVYIADGEFGIMAVDISDPSNPQELGTFNVLNPQLPAEARDVQYYDGRLYAAFWGAGFRIIDVSNPADMYETGFNWGLGYCQGILVAGERVFAAYIDAGIYEYSVQNPAAPIPIGYSNCPGDAYDGAAYGDYIFAADGNAGVDIIYIGLE